MAWRFKLRHIEVFRALMLTGSTIEAGRTLNISQPAVSRTLAELEAQLGTTLFSRIGGRLVPTPKAEWLFDTSQETLARVDHLDAILRDIDRMPQRPIRLFANSAMAHSILPDALVLFRQSYPQISVSTDVVVRRDNRRWLNEQEFDLAVTMLPVEYPADLITTLPMGEGVCILPPGHRLCAEPVIDLAMLDDEPLVVLQRHNLTRYKVEQAFDSAGLRCRIAVETATAASLVMFVTAGLGSGVIDPFTALKLKSLGYTRKPLRPRIEFSYGILKPMRVQAQPELAALSACIKTAYIAAMKEAMTF
ncbi:LysR substrate-binding domain-containing protein [Pelagibacterium sediminicola]|uniref:LysR substrate-binding domain-containing protein n=1 Tax=Pelagibacterium sediminicola TaxID=2248761 RepID=UPI0018E5880A|nr:LysR substrate-binding domain-containing protein [Pelagibacterium sediminicola]